MSKLSASVITREALLQLHNSHLHRASIELPANSSIRAEKLDSSKHGVQFASHLGIDPAWLTYSVGRFSSLAIIPAMYALARVLDAEPEGLTLSAELMELPKGVADAAAERLWNVAMRCVIDETKAEPRYPGWTRLDPKFYNIERDVVVPTRVKMLLRFDVCGTMAPE